jgi:5-methylcytosine-specific restriction endonuclease McrA
MKKHTRIYLDYFSYCEDDVIVCEVCNKTVATEIHHIENRKMGGTKTKDYIENLQAICRGCHIRFGDLKQHKEYLKQVHLNHIKDFKLTK